VLCVEQGRALTTLPDGTLRTRDAGGHALNVFSGCGVMAEYATLHVDNLVKIDASIPLDRAALVSAIDAFQMQYGTAIGKSGPLTVAEVRDLLGTSRKYAVPLCEWLDQTGATLRRGDTRILGPNP
jgi:Zn-dependent alcohol dehydrogenase